MKNQRSDFSKLMEKLSLNTLVAMVENYASQAADST